MDKIKKNNSVRNRKKKLKRESLIVYLIMLFGYIAGDIIYVSAVAYVFPIVQFVLLMLDVNYVLRYMVNCLMEIFFISIPFSFIFVGQAKLEVNDDKIERLDYFDEIDVIQKKDKFKKISKRENERQKKTIDEIMMKIEKLPRDKQMELLNYIKGSELLVDNNVSSEIDKLSDENISFLQDRFESVLFPNFDEKDDGYDYSRKKRK